MSAQPQPRLTPEQYLEIERAAELRHEYFNGRMFAMSGASYRHVIVTGNLSYALRNCLRKRPCTVLTTDLRLRVSPGGLYTYPDLVVLCGEPKFVDDQTDTLLNPLLIVEVLSPSTEAYDRGFKFAQYRTLESLQEYALVSQTEPRVEVFRRQSGRDWLLSESIGLDAACRFESVGCAVALAEVYDKVTFGGDEPNPGAARPSPGA
jgi:Uma2 family endonuclease